MIHPMTNTPLLGRRVLITGAGGGLGPIAAATAVAAGARVALWDRGFDTIDALRESLTDGPGSIERASAIDLLDAPTVGRAMGELVAAMNGLDAVWHLVGGYRGGVNFEDEPLDDFDLLFSLAIRTTVHVARVAAPALMKSPHGRFVTVSAPIASAPSGTAAAYSIAKAGSDAAVLSLADRFKGSTATANIVVVNAIATPAMIEADPNKDWSRFTTAQHLADTMAYVSSDAAATMNGQHVRLVGNA